MNYFFELSTPKIEIGLSKVIANHQLNEAVIKEVFTFYNPSFSFNTKTELVVLLFITTVVFNLYLTWLSLNRKHTSARIKSNKPS